MDRFQRARAARRDQLSSGMRRDVLLRSRQERRNAVATLGKSAPDGLKLPDKELEQISTQLDMMLRAAGRGSRAR